MICGKSVRELKAKLTLPDEQLSNCLQFGRPQSLNLKPMQPWAQYGHLSDWGGWGVIHLFVKPKWHNVNGTMMMILCAVCTFTQCTMCVYKMCEHCVYSFIWLERRVIGLCAKPKEPHGDRRKVGCQCVTYEGTVSKPMCDIWTVSRPNSTRTEKNTLTCVKYSNSQQANASAALGLHS